jgi:hypothetical protein
LKGESSVEPCNSPTENNNPRLPPGHKPCRFAKHYSRGNTARNLEEITPASSSVPWLILNGTNGFSESVGFFEITVELLESSQQARSCHGSSFDAPSTALNFNSTTFHHESHFGFVETHGKGLYLAKIGFIRTKWHPFQNSALSILDESSAHHISRLDKQILDFT